MSTLVSSLLGAVIVSLISLIGVISLSFQKKTLHHILLILVAFAAGGLIGSAFFHILPEALQFEESSLVFTFVITGFALFFVMEKVIYWRHCHDGVCTTHPFVYLNLIGDGIHNFVDGLIIVASFHVDVHVGIFTTATIVLHEIPQELGDFGVLLHGGFSVGKALFYNFVTALVSVLGVIVGFFLVNLIETMSNFLLAFAAGGFIYIAASDLVPELHKEQHRGKSILSFLFFLLGIILMWLGKLWLR